MKKIVLCLLASVILLSSVACVKPENPESTDTGSAASSGGDPSKIGLLEYAGLPSGLDYEGYEFSFFVRDYDKWISDVFAESSDENRVSEAVYKRNSLVGEELNVNIVCVPSSNWNYETDAMELIQSGEDVYDVVVPHARAAFVYANASLFLDWNKDLEYIHLDREYWDQNARKNLSVNNLLYVMNGDISYLCTGSTCALLFNKDMMKELNLEFPYQLVKDNEWDYDKFLEYATKAVKDLDGDQVMTKEDDRYGYVTGAYDGPIQILYTAGQSILNKDENDIPYISLNTPETIDVLEWFYSMSDNEISYVFKDMDADVAQTKLQAKDVFRESRALFTDVKIDSIAELRDSDVDFGIIPWPKMDSSYEYYYTNVDAGTNMFGVPMTADNPSRTSAVMEALAAEGHRSVVPEYYETALKTRYSRDEESAEMLDIICQGRVFDLGYFNYYMIGEMGNGLIAFLNTPSRNFASWYKKYESVTRRTLEKSLKNYGVDN